MLIFTTSEITTLRRDERSAGYDKTAIVGMYVAIKIKNPPLLWCKQSDIYEYFMESTWYYPASRGFSLVFLSEENGSATLRNTREKPLLAG